MRPKLHILATLLMLFSVVTMRADIVSTLNAPGSTVTITQPQALEERLKAPDADSDAVGSDAETDKEESSPDEREAVPQQRSKGKIVGYRVQVYADNNVRVAKGEARQRERALASRFPSYATYVAYASPYWRLRVGDFRSQSDAERAAAEIRRAFPSYAKEVRVVRDRINAR